MYIGLKIQKNYDALYLRQKKKQSRINFGGCQYVRNKIKL